MNYIISSAITYFLIANPIGNSPAILCQVKGFPFARQKMIMLREAGIAFLLALFFQYAGERFFSLLAIQPHTISLAGGIIFFFVGLGMLFPQRSEEVDLPIKQEPFIVPIATPLISGPALLTIIMLSAVTAPSQIEMSLALALAWVAITTVMFISPYLLLLIGMRGLLALEQMMGILILMMSVDMIINGTAGYIKSLAL